MAKSQNCKINFRFIDNLENKILMIVQRWVEIIVLEKC